MCVGFLPRIETASDKLLGVSPQGHQGTEYYLDAPTESNVFRLSNESPIKDMDMLRRRERELEWQEGEMDRREILEKVRIEREAADAAIEIGNNNKVSLRAKKKHHPTISTHDNKSSQSIFLDFLLILLAKQIKTTIRHHHLMPSHYKRKATHNTMGIGLI